jgi:hypothetical protein
MLAKRSLLTKKLCKRKALATCIFYTSFEMFPCFNYKKSNTKCVVLDKENLSCCSKYVFRKAKCNIKSILVSE